MSTTGAEDALIVVLRDRGRGCKVSGWWEVWEASPQTDCLFNRQKLTAVMADSSNLNKALVIKAEDARIVGDMKLMKRYYADLFALNNELVEEYTKRCNTRSC